jgi:3-isopropylmalate dehydrogenase
MKKRIAVIKGDGIGPEVVGAAMGLLDKLGKKAKVEFEFEELLAGGAAIDALGEPLPAATLAACKASDAVLLGAVGGPKWDLLPGDRRPEKALLGLRGGLGLFANLRPATLHEALASACPLRAEAAKAGIDVLVVRELTGGIYFGDRGRRVAADGSEEAYDTEAYSVTEIERIARVAFDCAKGRRKKVTSVDKANILESSRLWRSTVDRVAKDYPGIAVEHMYVDNAAMQLVRSPSQFDVMLTSNMFGDILSDEASMITGSIGMLPSASLGSGSLGMYEPIHGTAPDIAGQDKANPIATMLSAAMMLRHSLELGDLANDIEAAVAKVLKAGYRTGDIMSEGMMPVGTKEMSRLVLEAL